MTQAQDTTKPFHFSLSVKQSLIALLIICIALAIASMHFAWFRPVEFAISDYYAKRQAHTQPFDERIVVVDIDDYSLVQMQDIAGKWPWPRSVFAEVIESLDPVSPKALLFDILFAERDRYRPDSDAYFNEVLASVDNVYLASLVLQSEPEQGQIPVQQLQQFFSLKATDKANKSAKINLLLPEVIEPKNWQIGLINYISDSDGKARRYYAHYPYQGWRIPSLPARVVADFDVPLPEQPSIDLAWKDSDSLQRIRFVDLYQAVANQDTEFLQQLSQKFLIIGSTASGLHDLKLTPISDHYPGVYVVATALDNLLNQDYLNPVTPAITWLALVLSLTLLLANFFSRWTFRRQLLVASGVLIGLSLLLIGSEALALNAGYLFVSGSIIANMLTSYLLFTITLGLLEHLQRKKAENLFGRFLDPKVVKQLVSSGELDIENTSQDVNISILFSDIRGFTSLSEKHTAKEIVELLNRYFDLQVKTIFATNGTLDKFIGDCIMAFWGAPVANSNHADDAIEAALQMEQHLIEFQQSLAPELRTFDVGIGVHTGETVVGMIGASQRVDYTAIGDAVNLASRIEGLTKDKARILVSEATKQASSGKYNFSYCGEFQVKGREQPVKLYQPSRAE